MPNAFQLLRTSGIDTVWIRAICGQGTSACRHASLSLEQAAAVVVDIVQRLGWGRTLAAENPAHRERADACAREPQHCCSWSS